MELDHVAIIGAGIAGLLVAAALAPLAGRVTLFEPDALPSAPTARAGVPQGHHSHVLLTRGRRAFEELLPGLDASLAQHAPDELDWTLDCHVFSSAGRVPRFPSAIKTRPCTRPLLEHVLRRRVLALGNVSVSPASVVALETSSRAVSGVRTASGVTRAALVVDAAGRRSRTPDWLAAMGLPRPAEQIVDAHLGYATRLFERPSSPRDFQGLVVSTRPPHNPRAAALWPVEDGQWLVTLAGASSTHPPVDDAGFLDFAAALQTPMLRDAIAGARPTSKIHGYRDTANRWRRYDRLPSMPDGLVVVGDGVCVFNPIYGQGMTVAALEAQELARQVERRRAPRGLSTAYQRAIVRAIQPAWLLATSEDSRWPATEGGDHRLSARASFWYLDRLMDRTPRSPELVETFLSVVHMLRSPAAFVRPGVIARVLAREPRGRA